MGFKGRGIRKKYQFTLKRKWNILITFSWGWEKVSYFQIFKNSQNAFTDTLFVRYDKVNILII